MSSNDVIVRLRAIGQQAFTSAMEDAAKSVGHIGDQAKKTGSQTDQMSNAAGKAAPKWRSLAVTAAKFAGGAIAIRKMVHGLHSAIESTEELATGTLRLNRTTGMEMETASAWAEVTRVRGINAQSFQRGLVSLSKQMESARHGTKASIQMFDDLGVSMDAIKAGDTGKVMMQMSDGFAAMKNPAQKAAYAQKLLARQGQELLPMFNQGSAAIQEQLDMAKKYGAVIGEEGTEHTKEFMARQRELKIAMDGLKVSIGESLMPVIVSLAQMFARVTATVQPLLRNATFLKITVASLTVAFIAYKVAVIASTVASMGMVAVWALIPVAIIAIGAALVYAYKKVGWFRNAVDAAFAFIKKHWRALLAAMTLGMSEVVIQLVTNFGKIRAGFRTLINAAKSIYHAVTGTFSALWAAIRRSAEGVIRFFSNLGRRIVEGIVNGIKSAPGAIMDALKSLLPGGKAGRLISKAIPGLAAGGVVRSGGVALVGERGPEVLSLDRGARVTPLPSPTIAPLMAAAAGPTTIRVPVYLNNRVLTEAVAQHTADTRARR